MKVTDLAKTLHDSGKLAANHFVSQKRQLLADSEGEDDNSDTEDDPSLEVQSVPHYGGVNRVRVRAAAGLTGNFRFSIIKVAANSSAR